jgi:hypothetical protein
MNGPAPIVLPDRQEQFCLAILGGDGPTEAYRKAYGRAPSVCSANGSRLLANARVKARIAQLRAFEAAARKIDLPFLTAGLLKAYDLGLATRQASAAAQAMMGVAKLHGFVIDRAQVDAVIRKPSLDPLSPDEMDESKWLSANAPILELTAGAPSLQSPQSPEGLEPRDSTDQATPSTDQVHPKVVPGGA